MIANIVSDKELVVLIHNAYAYITRKKVRTGILFLILMVILISLYGCLSILSSNLRMEKSLNEVSLSSIVVQKKDGSEFENQFFNNSVYEYDFVSKLEDAKTVSIKQGVKLDSLPEEYKNVVSVVGTNNTSKNVLFRSGVFTLISGKNINSKDRNSILIHSDLAKKNHLKVGDKLLLRSNIYDADNEKGADETVEVTIKGLFDGHNQGGVTAAQELYENNLITDLDTAAKVYGNTEKTAVYQDATFFVKGNKDLDQVIKNLRKLDINWNEYVLVKSTSNYPALQKSIRGMYSVANKMFIGSLIFAGIVVTLLLFMWMNARRKEIAILMALGISKMKIFIQFVLELCMVTIPAYILAYFIAGKTASSLGTKVLNNVSTGVAKEIAKESASNQLGGGAEVDGFNKMLTHIDATVEPKYMMYVIIFMSIVMFIALVVSTTHLLNKNCKELMNEEE